MIMGVDHLAVTATSVDGGVAALERNGYLTKFVDRGVPNPESKSPLLRNQRNQHDIAYCQRPDSVAIEVTVHTDFCEEGGHPGFLPVFRGAMAALEPQPSWFEPLESMFEEPFVVGQSRDSAAPIGLIAGPEAVRLHAVIVPVPDIEVAERFWTSALRVRPVQGGDGWLRAQFASPVRSWSLPVFFVETAAILGPTYLDDPGFRCVALLSSDFEKDLSRIGSAGATDVAPFDINVGGRNLRAAIFRTPDGNIAEILQIPDRA